MRRSRTISPRSTTRRSPASRVKSFLRVGSWIGGDRDGNPFVTAEVLSEATRLQSARALGHYLDELHELGGELSLSGTLIARDARTRRARRALDATRRAARSDEPYRRAIAGIYSRARQDRRDARPFRRACAIPSATRRPMRRPRISPPISRRSRIRWKRAARAILARGRLRALRRAVDVFGFHLAPLDLRQNSDVHERTVAELFAAAEPGVEYLKLDEEARIALLRKELVSPRPLLLPFHRL